MALSTGTRLGPYEIRFPLGTGGMGEVYSARDTRLGRDVAIKVLPPEFAADADRLRRFEQEARAASSLNNPNVLTIFDVGEQDGAPYVVFELLDGATLRKKLFDGRLEVSQALDFGLQVTRGLAAAHAKGIVHRDLKPENLFLTRDGLIKILDFGLAKLVRPEGSAPSTETPTVTLDTEPGSLLGTVGYMSPEQVLQQPADHRSDIFSLGAVLYEMLTGRRAFQGASKVETLSAILKEEPAAMTDSMRTVPASVERVTRRCLEKKPDKRFDSARDLAFALEAASQSTGGIATRTLQSRAQHPLRMAAAILGVVAAISLAGFRLLRPHTVSPGFESVAVLPFASAGQDPASASVTDGVTDALIDRLSGLSSLRVISRAATLAYKGRSIDPQQVGHDLKVQAVLTGRVLREPGTITIAVELADARDGRHVWGERYVRKTSDAVAFEPEIAREIVDSLKFRLSGDDGGRFSKRSAESPEAYQLYVKGRYFWNTWELEKAKEYFEKAIAKDPAYAVAYAGLSDTYAKLGVSFADRPSEAFPRARAAALEALKIDDTLVEARVALAGVKACYDRNFGEAERDLRQAIAMQPTYAIAHRRYARLLDSMRRFDEAIAEIRRAEELEPLVGFNNVTAAGIFADAGRYAEGMEECRIAAEIDPNSAHAELGLLYLVEHRFGDAIEEYRKADAASGHDAGALAELGFAYGASGRRAEAETILRQLQSLAARRYLPAYYRALVYTGLGNNALAIEWIGKGLDDHESLAFVNADPRFASLRADPRFGAVARRLGLT